MKRQSLRWFLVLSLILFGFGTTPVLASEIETEISETEISNEEISEEIAEETDEIAASNKVITVKNVKFELRSDGTAVLVDGSKAKGKYTIPKAVTYNNKSYSVKEVAAAAFYGNEALTEIVMSSSVVKIADGDENYRGAFGYCPALEKVTLSKKLQYIGSFAFGGCASLKNVELPETLTTIETEAFFGCKSITSMVLPDSVVSVGQCAFTQTSLKKFTIPATATSFSDWALDGIETLQHINVEKDHPHYASYEGAVYTKNYDWITIYPIGKKDESYQVHENTTTIRTNMLAKNKYLKEFILNNKMNADSLGTALLSRSNVESIVVPKDNPNLKSVSGVLYTKDGKTLLLYPPAKKDKIFFIPSGVEAIGRPGCYSFEDTQNLRELYVPASVKTWDGLMWRAQSLEKVVFAADSQLETLTPFVFTDCTKLESICLPKSFKSLNADDGWGSHFMNCQSLEYIYIAKGAPFYKEGSWGIQSLSGFIDKNIYGHGTNNRVSQMAEQFYCHYVNVSGSYNKVLGVTFEDTEITVKAGGKKNVSAVVYPENTTAKTLKYVSSNTSVAKVSSSGVVTGVSAGTCYITATATDGSGEYAKCKVIVKQSLEDAKVTLSTNSYDYDGKSKKPSVTVKIGSKTLKKGTDYTVGYKDNKNIGTATVTIKGTGKYTGSVKKTFTIKAKAGATFTADGLKYKVTSPSNKTVSFTGISSTSTTKVILPKTVTYGGASFKVTGVAESALKSKTKVTSVTIGENVTSIGKNAFYGCSSLKTITIKSSKLENVGSNALKGIYAKATIKVPEKQYSSYKKLLNGKGQGSGVKIVK